MGIFGRLGNLFSGQSGEQIAIENAEKALSAVAGSITDGQKAALASVATNLTRRFDYEIDVLDLPSNSPTFPQVWAARSDLLAVADTMSSRPSLAPTANELRQDLTLASLIFYNFILMRGLAGQGGQFGPRAHQLANTYSAFLRRVFPD